MAELHIKKGDLKIDITGDTLADVDRTLWNLYRIWDRTNKQLTSELFDLVTLQKHQARLLKRHQARQQAGG